VLFVSVSYGHAPLNSPKAGLVPYTLAEVFKLVSFLCYSMSPVCSVSEGAGEMTRLSCEGDIFAGFVEFGSAGLELKS
jgi:hypothetical protein